MIQNGQHHGLGTIQWNYFYLYFLLLKFSYTISQACYSKIINWILKSLNSVLFKLSTIQVITMYASASYGGGNAWMKIMGIGDQGGKRKKDKEKNGSTTR